MQLMLKKSKKLSELRNRKDFRIGFADSESISLTNPTFRCGSVAFMFKKEPITFFTTSLKEWVEYMLDNFECIYFFNITYDSNYIRNYLIENTNMQEFEISSGTKMLGLKFTDIQTKKFIIFKDIMTFCNTSLDEACSEYNCQTKKFPDFSFELDKDKRKKMMELFFQNCSDEDIQHHNINDSVMLMELGYAMRNIMFDLYHLDLFNKKIYSLPSFAIKCFKSNFIEKELPNSFCSIKITHIPNKKPKFTKVIDEKGWNFVKKSYKGGYCNVLSTELYHNVKSYDVSSAYPFAITSIRFPVGKYTWTFDLDNFIENAMKIPSFCEVVMKEDKGILCGVRDGKLVRLFGVFHETITSFELLYALRKGAKIVKFIKGMVFKEYDKHNSFSRFEKYSYKIKCNSEGGRKTSAKKICNSSYGKTAQNYKQKKSKFLYYRDMAEFEEDCNTLPNLVKTFVSTNKKVGIITIEEETTSYSDYMFITWGSLICAFERIYLLDNGIDYNSIYYDTDSTKILEEFNEMFEKNPNFANEQIKAKTKNKKNLLGFFEFEYNCIDFRALAPKFYAYSYFDEKDKSIHQHVKGKGVPFEQKQKFYDEMIKGNESFITEKYIKIMNPKESINAKIYLAKNSIFGGVRETQKELNPKPKEEKVLNEVYEDFNQRMNKKIKLLSEIN